MVKKNWSMTMEKKNNEGVLIVISSPSGTGKTTICKKLLEFDKNLYLSVSVTTRKRRLNEIEGIDYYFETKENFLKLKKENKFIETAIVFQNYYGTLKEQVLDKLADGVDVLIDIDWQSTRQINEYMKHNIVKIFLLPPSLKELANRLSARGSESDEEIEFRMSQAVKEIKHFDQYDYVLINDDVENVFSKIRLIIEVERMKLMRQKSIKNFVTELSNN